MLNRLCRSSCLNSSKPLLPASVVSHLSTAASSSPPSWLHNCRNNNHHNTSSRNMSSSSSSSSSSSYEYDYSNPLPFPSPNWFRHVFGFEESSDHAETQARLLAMQRASGDPTRQLRRDDGVGRDITAGTFTTPSVQDLRNECARLLAQEQQQWQQQRQQQQQQQQWPSLSSTTATVSSSSSPPPPPPPRLVRWTNIVASVLDLHADPRNDGAIIQAASQFNCLEMVHDDVTPEDGIAGYANDRTQGPACAMACSAGTAWRNYLVVLGRREQDGSLVVGQSRRRQINTLQPVLDAMTRLRGDGVAPGIKVKNGYTNSTNRKLQPWHALLRQNAEQLVGTLQVGLQADAQVTYPQPSAHAVTQVYCSALSVSYSQASPASWEPLARIVLRGAYEATLLAAVKQGLERRLKNTTITTTTATSTSSSRIMKNGGDRDNAPTCPTKVYLTLVGGGVFGNDLSWIWDAMRHAHRRVIAANYGVALDICIVHYRDVESGARALVDELNDMQSSAE